MIAAIDLQGMALVAALLILTFTILRSMRRRGRTSAPGLVRSPSRDPGSDGETRVRRSMEELLVELQGISRQINAQLDTKMRALTQLTEQARQEIERLERLLDEARTGQTEVPPSPVAEKPPGGPAASVDPRHRRVHELADTGLSAVEIARQTGQPVGEVELILSLRSTGPPGVGEGGGEDVHGGRVDLRT